MWLESRYGDAYQYGLYPLSDSTVTVKLPDNTTATGPGQFYCGPNGDTFLRLVPQTGGTFEFLAFYKRVGKFLQASGVFEGGGSLEESEFMVQSVGSDGVVLAGHKPKIIVEGTLDSGEACSVSCSLINFAFHGMEMIKVGDRLQRDLTTVNCFGKEHRIQRCSYLDDELAILLKNGVLRHLPAARIDVSGVPVNEVEQAISRLRILAGLISIVAGTHVVADDFRVSQGGCLRQTHLTCPPAQPFNTEARIWAAIDSDNGSHHLKQFLETCSQEAEAIWNPMDLATFGTYLCLTLSQRYMEIRLALLILSIEHVMSKYLQHAEGATDTKLQDMNLLQKLKWANIKC